MPGLVLNSQALKTGSQAHSSRPGREPNSLVVRQSDALNLPGGKARGTDIEGGNGRVERDTVCFPALNYFLGYAE